MVLMMTTTIPYDDDDGDGVDDDGIEWNFTLWQIFDLTCIEFEIIWFLLLYPHI